MRTPTSPLSIVQHHPHEQWRSRAACTGLDTATFFPDLEAPDAEARVAEALAVCSRCPVREQCLEFAISTRQQDGIFGGVTADERRRIRRRRREAARRAS